MSVILKLGSVTFADTEIPEHINFGGEQALVIHELVGGARIVDAMGRHNAPVEWHGLFLGQNALSRARQLDNLRVKGAALELSWSELRFKVVIQSFHADFERAYQIPYHIHCVVVDDLAKPALSLLDDGLNLSILTDMANAVGLGGVINDATLTSALNTLNSAVTAVTDFTTATQAAINSVLVPIQQVQNQVGVLLGSVGAVITSVSTLGGIVPGNPISNQIAAFTGQLGAMAATNPLYQVQSAMNRMSANLSSIGTSGAQVTVAGGNLFNLAATAYNDPTQWTAIAKANNLTDPVVSGVQTLNVPTSANTTTGVLNAG